MQTGFLLRMPANYCKMQKYKIKNNAIFHRGQNLLYNLSNDWNQVIFTNVRILLRNVKNTKILEIAEDKIYYCICLLTFNKGTF